VDGDEAGVVVGVRGSLGDHVIGITADVADRLAGDLQQRVQRLVDRLVRRSMRPSVNSSRMSPGWSGVVISVYDASGSAPSSRPCGSESARAWP